VMKKDPVYKYKPEPEMLAPETGDMLHFRP
jgi:hypothetical protein